MGHDIKAYKPGIDLDATYKSFNLDSFDEYWADRYEQYKEITEVAYLRRSAGDPLNQVIYKVLGVMDEVYSGCSGTGEQLPITLTQFKDGLRILDSSDFSELEREPNLIDDMMACFKSAGVTIVEVEGEASIDVSPERNFLKKCMRYCEDNNLEELNVEFG